MVVVARTNGLVLLPAEAAKKKAEEEAAGVKKAVEDLSGLMKVKNNVSLCSWVWTKHWPHWLLMKSPGEY